MQLSKLILPLSMLMMRKDPPGEDKDLRLTANIACVSIWADHGANHFSSPVPLLLHFLDAGISNNTNKLFLEIKRDRVWPKPIPHPLTFHRCQFGGCGQRDERPVFI